MSDTTRGHSIEGAGGIGQNKLSKAQTAKLSLLGKSAISTLFMLMRNVKMYDPENDIFAQPLAALVETINQVVAGYGQFNLQAVGTMLALNGVVIKVDFSSLENLRALTNAFKERDMGGFSVNRPVTTAEIKAFLRIFQTQGQAGVTEALPGVVNIRVGRYKLIREALRKQSDEEINRSRKVDRDKYALTVYARAVTYVRHLLSTAKKGEALPSTSAAGRVVRDIVDLSRESKRHFLGMTAAQGTGDYLAYHSVNTCLIAVVMGIELGLTREQLYELGRAALHHELGLTFVDDAVVNKQEALTPAEREEMRRIPLYGARMLMRSRPLDLAALKAVVATYDAKQSFFRRVIEDGDTRLEPRTEISLFGRIIRVASIFDAMTSARPFREAFSTDMALTIMANQMSAEFDPYLLRLLYGVLEGEMTVRFDPKGVRVDLFT